MYIYPLYWGCMVSSSRMVKLIVHLTSLVFHWGHIFLESKCLHLQGAFNNYLHNCKGVKECICFNTEDTRYIWIPVLFSVLITNGSNKVVCHSRTR